MPAAGGKDVADDENIAAEQQAGDRDQGVAAFRIVAPACPQRHREAKIIAQAAEERQDNRDQRLRIHDRQKEGYQADAQHDRAKHQRPADDDADVPRSLAITRRERIVQFLRNQAFVKPLPQFFTNNPVFLCHIVLLRLSSRIRLKPPTTMVRKS